MNRQSLEELLNVPYTIQVREVKNKYIVWIDELGLSAEANELGDAYGELTKLKEQHISRMHESGNDLPPPAVSEEAAVAAGLRPYIPFAIKTGIITLFILIILYSTQLVITRMASNLPRNAATLVVRGFDHLGQTSTRVSEERMRDIGKKIGLLMKNVQPLLSEVEKSLEEAKENQDGLPMKSGPSQ